MEEDYRIYNIVKRKYGTGNGFRLAMLLYKSNMPENIWDNVINNKIDKEVTKLSFQLLEEMIDKQLVIINYRNNSEKIAHELVANIIINSGDKNCYRIDFFVLMTKALTKYGAFNLNLIMEEFFKYDIVYISDIICGEMYNKYKDYFLIIISNLINDVKMKNIILSFENVKDFKEAYGDIPIKNNINITI